MRKIRIAQIGVNRYSHATEIFDTIKSMPDLFDIVGYTLVEDEAESCAKKLKHFEGYSKLTLREILEDPTIEAVTVETDEIHLTKYAQLAAEHGKHIHMEKPGSQNLDDFKKLIDTVKQSKKVFHIGYMYRYNPFISEVINQVKCGALGSIYSVEAHMSRFDKDATREWFGTFKGGMMFYLGCHLIDLVLQIQGLPSEVIPLNTSTGICDINTEDLGFAVLKYPNAISVIRMGGTEVGGSKRRQLVVCGSERTVEIRPLEIGVKGHPGMLYTEKTERFKGAEGRIQESFLTSDSFGRYDKMMSSFAEMVRGEKENPYTYDYELQLFKLILQCCGM